MRICMTGPLANFTSFTYSQPAALGWPGRRKSAADTGKLTEIERGWCPPAGHSQLGTFRGFGIERARLAGDGLGTKRARLAGDGIATKKSGFFTQKEPSAMQKLKFCMKN